MKKRLKVFLALLLALSMLGALVSASADAPAADGLHEVNNVWQLYLGGEYAGSYTGLYCDPNVGWWLIKDGNICWGYTGLWNDSTYGWWMIENASVSFGFNGIWNDETYGSWVIVNGQPTEPANATPVITDGLHDDGSGVWHLYQNGQVATGFTGLYGDANVGWWLVNAGTVAFDYNGLYCDQNFGWWLVRGGTIAWDFTGDWKDPAIGGVWSILNGALQGPVQTAFSGLNCDGDGVWRLYLNGEAASGYNGLYGDAALGWWLVENGVINFSYTGLYNDAVGWWLVNEGRVNFDYNGIYNDAKAGAWLVLGGTIAWDYSGTYTDPVLGKKNIVNGHVEGGETPAGGDLTLWSIEVEDGINRAAYESAIADFNAANPGYTMTMEATENNAYKDKIREAMASGQDLPDVFFTWGMSFLGDFVDQGNVLCLDDVLPEYKEYLTDAVLANTSFDGKLYGIPLNMSVVTMFVNMDLLKQAGIDKVPETYEELIACCEALVAHGITPFGVPGEEAWCISEYTEPLLVKTIGAQGLADCYSGAASWDQPGVIDAMNKFIQLRQYFDPDAATMNSSDVLENFINGKYAFYQNGSWNCGEIARGSEFDVEATMFPVVDSTKSSLYQTVGGPNDSLAVAATTQSPEVVSKGAFEMAKKISYESALNGAGLPAWKADFDNSVIDKLSNQVTKLLEKSDGMVLYGDNYLTAETAETYLDYTTRIFAGEINAEQFAKGLAAEFAK